MGSRSGQIIAMAMIAEHRIHRGAIHRGDMASDDDATTEIERKFLVESDAWKPGAVPVPIVQGYLARTELGVVRVRTCGLQGFLTVKSKQSGITCREFEYEVPLTHAEAMLDLCEGARIEKTRSRVEHGGHIWEVDIFMGANAGLVVAEIELDSEDEAFSRPEWLGAELTADRRFDNSQLSLTPYDPSWDVPKR
jgi:adenylate cyclase